MSIYASVVTLDAVALYRLKITDTYSLHRVVYSLFDKDEPGRILYSDQKMRDNQRRVYVLSTKAPSDSTPEGYGTVNTTELSPSLLDHGTYKFQTTVNPVRSSKGKRTPVKGASEICQWFTERGADWGFEVDADSIQLERHEVAQFNSKTGDPVTLGYATVSGVLSVKDKARFSQSFEQGLGKGKAFGCGLLQISPIDYQPFM